jgi:hypothetical protein
LSFGWVIITVYKAEGTVSIVQPNLNAFARECLFDNDVRRTIAIHIEDRERKRSLSRCEAQLLVFARRNVKFNSKSLCAVAVIAAKQDCSVELLILVKIGGRQPLRKSVVKQSCTGVNPR